MTRGKLQLYYIAATLFGAIFPPQLLYGGKTDKCHPDIEFISDWDIFHTENHWSNTATILYVFHRKGFNLYLQSKYLELG